MPLPTTTATTEQPRSPSPATGPTSTHGLHVGGGGGHGLYWPQNHELTQLQIPDLLGIAARNALLVIPSERCVVFMYDKASNMLSAQVTSSSGDASMGNDDDDDDDAQNDHEQDDELSFAPVMGVVSACFLQRRCLRMQEPHLHKAFHKEYDVPRDVHMNSIIVAPVILHHRTVGVIQLLNRIDPDAYRYGGGESYQEETTPASAAGATTDASGDSALSGTSSEEDKEVTLVHSTTVQQRPRMGFTAKDEQKMIQFTSHVAQLLDNKLKILAHGESQAKLREERAKTAMELLNMMNDKLELQPTTEPAVPTIKPRRISVPVLELMEMASNIERGDPDKQASVLETIDDEDSNDQKDLRPPLEQLPVLTVDAHMIKMLVGISRTQALFRGHHLRKIHRLSEALQQHKTARRKERSALVIQRATRLFLARRWRKRRRAAVLIIVRAFRRHRFRGRLAERQEIKKRQKRKRSMLVATASSTGKTKAAESEMDAFRKRLQSATCIQSLFRGYRARRQVKGMVGFSNAAKGVKNIVKLQSFLRGSIAKRQVERIRQEKRAARAAHVVCMRLASTESAGDRAHGEQEPGCSLINSRTCVYPLPARSSAHIQCFLAGQHSPSSMIASHELRLGIKEPTTSTNNRFRRLRHVAGSLNLEEQDGEDSEGEREGISILSLESRPLAATCLVSPRSSSKAEQPQAQLLLATPRREEIFTRVELARRNPLVVFDIDAKRAKRCPAGVQHADDWLPRNRPKGLPMKPGLAERCMDNQSIQAASTLPRLAGRPAPHISSSPRQGGGPESNQLQVCFLPAANPRVSVHGERSSSVAQPPRQPRSSQSYQRALTTR